MNLQQARCLDAVARLGSFRRAADELVLTQPAVSHHVARLERELGVDLVSRGRRGAQLTEAGAVLLPRVRNLMAAEASVRDEASAWRDRNETDLRLATVNYSLVEVLAPLLARFSRQHPGHRLEVVELTAGGVLRQVTEGACDLGVLGALGDQLPEVAGVRFREFGVTELELVAPTGHPLLRARRVDPAAVAREPLVSFAEGVLIRDALGALLAGHRHRVVCEVSTVAAVRSLVAAGVGVALIPRPTDGAGTAGVGYRPVLPAPVPITRVLAEPDRPHRPAAAAAFVALLDSHGPAAG